MRNGLKSGLVDIALESENVLTIAGHAKVRWIDDFVGGGVREYSFGMYAGLVCKRAEAGDIVVEGDIDLHSSRDQVLNSFKLGKIVLAPDVVSISDQHACNESSERGDPIPFTDAQD